MVASGRFPLLVIEPFAAPVVLAAVLCSQLVMAYAAHHAIADEPVIMGVLVGMIDRRSQLVVDGAERFQIDRRVEVVIEIRPYGLGCGARFGFREFDGNHRRHLPYAALP